MPDESVLGGTAGVPILGDLVGANFVQRVKLDVGGDGASVPVAGALPVSATQLPAALGGTTAAASLPVVLSSDGPFASQTGAVTETAPSTDTASSGLNGRLQRIAQRLTSIIGLLPASLGQKAMTASLPVVLANDQSALPISGSVTATFSGSLPAGTNNVGKVDVNVLPGTYAEDAAHASGDVGHFILGVRNDAGGALAGTTGDYIPLTTDSTGAMRVTGGGGGTQYTEDVASAGAESMTLAGAIRQDTPASSTSADGDYANMKVDSVGRLWTNPSGVTQPVSAASLPLPTGASTEATLDARTGSLTETAPTTDTASSGINGRLQRVAQRLTSLIALLPTALGAGGGLKVDGSGTALPISQVGSATNASGQVTISSTSATIIASRAGRRGVILVNNQTVPVYIDAAGGTATTSKFRLDPGAALTLPVTSAVTGITSAAYTASPADAQIHYVELY